MTERHLDLLQKHRELQKAFDDTLEMNRKLGSENWKFEKENEQLKQQIEEMKNCYNCHNFCDRNVDCSSICVRNNPTVKQLKDYWKMKDIY